MKELIAVFAGCVFILFAMLMLGLAYVFLAVTYNSLSEMYPLLSNFVGYFRYLVGMPVFMLTMFGGGFITAFMSGSQRREVVISLGVVVGIITASAMILPSLENSDMTNTGIAIFLLSLISTAAGGLYAIRVRRPQGDG